MSNQFYLLLILMLIFIKFVGRSQKHDLFLFGGLKKLNYRIKFQKICLFLFHFDFGATFLECTKTLKMQNYK